MKTKGTPDRAQLLGDTPPELLELGARLHPSKGWVLKFLDRFEAIAKAQLKEFVDGPERPGEDEYIPLLRLFLGKVELCRRAIVECEEPWRAAYFMHEVCTVANMLADADPELRRMLYVGRRVIDAGSTGHDPAITERRHAQYRAEYDRLRAAGLGKMAARKVVAKKHGVAERTLRRVGCKK
jgi:hypothetical protein